MFSLSQRFSISMLQELFSNFCNMSNMAQLVPFVLEMHGQTPLALVINFLSFSNNVTTFLNFPKLFSTVSWALFRLSLVQAEPYTGLLCMAHGSDEGNTAIIKSAAKLHILYTEEQPQPCLMTYVKAIPI